MIAAATASMAIKVSGLRLRPPPGSTRFNLSWLRRRSSSRSGGVGPRIARPLSPRTAIATLPSAATGLIVPGHVAPFLGRTSLAAKKTSPPRLELARVIGDLPRPYNARRRRHRDRQRSIARCRPHHLVRPPTAVNRSLRRRSGVRRRRIWSRRCPFPRRESARRRSPATLPGSMAGNLASPSGAASTWVM